MLSDGELRNAGVFRGGKEGMVGHPAWHLEFLRDHAEAPGKNRTLITFLSPNNQENGSLKKAVANGSIE